MYKVSVNIEGMVCGMCEAHVNDAIRKIYPKAKKVSSSHTKKLTTFVVEEPADEEKVKAAVAETGYTFVSMSQEPYKRKLFG